MAGPFFSTFLLSGFLAATPGGFTFEGREASARTEQPDGFFIQGPLPFTDLAEDGTGSASLSVEDRVSLPGATYGDKGQLAATFRLGGVEYRVELTQPGFPPPQVRGQAASGPLPRPPPHTIGGGVLLDVPLYGDSGLGWAAMTRTHAAVAVWGVGSVWRNGQLLTDTAFVHAAALAAGTYADDDTHRLLRQARFGDTELVVVLWNLPPSMEPRGFIQFVFEDVAITVDGTSVPSRAVVENTGNPPADFRTLTPTPPTTILGAPLTGSPEPAPVPATGMGGSGTASTDLATAPGGSPETTPGAATDVGVAGGGRDIVATEGGGIVAVGGATTGTGGSGTTGTGTTPEGGAAGTGTGLGTSVAGGGTTTTGAPLPAAETGVVGGPVTATTPAPAEGSGALGGTGQPSVAGVAGGALVTPPGSTVGPSLPGSEVPGLPVTPDVTSGTFPVTGAPNPPVNISGSLPGTPAPGSQPAAEGAVVPGTAPPGSASGFGPATSTFATAPGGASTLGFFSVQAVTPGTFDAFLGTAQSSTGIIATPPPLNSDTATPPSALLGSPAPLTAGQAPPLLGTPAPLTAAPATPLPATPSPGNVTPGASTSTAAPAAPAAPATSPGGTGVPPSI
ncbi:hypothetical protein [Pyxidicoccus sp. MSG2]|uniref:hypothetical protein n=1 Tax=Pyxidicoccus sp. MSG2 TaxID=2996790 RepID=UPI002271D9B1|nr:hypothetical protein [Pyxidicoccus sp. MSG2]MCY1015256.1 hypothetical protein [Pyxidicoccus sp. MSG2]